MVEVCRCSGRISPPLRELLRGLSRGVTGRGVFRILCAGLISLGLLITTTTITGRSQTFSPAGAGAPEITSPPVPHSVIEGASHAFTVVATGLEPLAYQWVKDGVALNARTNPTLPLTNITTNDAGHYSVQITNSVGAVTSVTARLTVRLSTDPAFPTPHGGWTYRYDGAGVAGGLTGALDGTWNRQNSLDAWVGDGRGAGNGLPGGISSTNGIMTLEDAVTSGSGFNNRRYFLTHDISQDAGVTNGTTLLDDGVTLTFRARLTPATDPWIEIPNAPNGFINNSDGKALFGIRQAGSDGMAIGFSLNNATEDTSTTGTFAFGQAGLHMNNLNGNVRSSNVDPGEGGTLSLLPLDPAQFHEFWINIRNNGSAPGTHQVSIYLDGSTTPTVFNVTAGTGSEPPYTNYLALGVGSTLQRGAADIDFFGYRPGIILPAQFNQPAGIVTQPQTQFVVLSNAAVFQVGITGTPPFAIQWFRDGNAISGATNEIYVSPPITTNDLGAQFTVSVGNEFGSVTSSPPALVLLLEPPVITSPPQDVVATNGGVAVLTVGVTSGTPPTFQWRRGGLPLVGANSSSLTFNPVTTAEAGGYDVIIANAGGSVTSTVAVLTVRVEDWGDAPGAGLATSKGDNGARHLVSPGIHLGLLIDDELDGQPALSANGDDAAGASDEDGVTWLGPLRAGQSASVQVVASTNGFLNAWIDFAGDGNWTGLQDQILTNALVVTGTNVIGFAVPAGAIPGNTYARFRFGTVAGVTFEGTAGEGEVEDYLLSIGGSADLRLGVSASPSPVAANATLTYTLLITNHGPSIAGEVVLTNTLSAGVSFLSALASQGNCSYSAGVVICELGPLFPQEFAEVILEVQTGTTGSITNTAIVSSGEFDPNASNNVVALPVEVLAAPLISAQPVSQSGAIGSTVTFSVTASGTTPLTYQWRRNGVALEGQTNASIVLANLAPANAGAYTVRVTNVVGSVVSDAANLIVLGPPTVIAQPASQTNYSGGTAQITVGAAGSEPLHYTWFFNETNRLVDQNAATLTVTGVQTSNSGAYRVVISNAVGVATSAPASLLVFEADFGDALGADYRTLLVQNGARHRLVPGIRLGAAVDFEPDGQPNSHILGDDAAGVADEDGVTFANPVNIGQSASVTVTASTNGWLQAWIDYDRDGSWTNELEQVMTNQAVVPGPNVLNFQVPSGALGGSTVARFRFSTQTNLAVDGEALDGEVEDHPLALVARTDLAVSHLTPPGPIAVGSNLVYSILVTNAGPALAGSVQLTSTLPSGVGFVSAAASLGSCSQFGNSVTCSLNSMPVGSSRLVTITVIPTVAGNLSNVVAVSSTATEIETTNNTATVVHSSLLHPVILTAPRSQTVTNGGNASFSVSVSATTPRYQWRFNSIDLPNATNVLLSIINAQATNEGSYSVFVSNAVGTVLSAPVTLTVLRPVSITTHPVSQTVSTGATVVLTVVATGTGPLTYQWQRNGEDLATGNGATLTLSNVTVANAGTYRVRVSNPINSVLSAAATLSVFEPPVFTSHPQSRTNLVSSTAVFTAAASGSPPLTYQWLFNQTNALAGQTNGTLTLTNVQLAQSGGYSLAAFSSGLAATSLVAVLTVIQADFGDAPELLNYPTTLPFNGAHHQIVSGIHLGGGVDAENDGQPNLTATGDNLSGIADEDGVTFPAPLLQGYSSPVQVVVSTNGFIDAWVDHNVNGTWVDTAEQVLTSHPVSPGTNLLSISIPGFATAGPTFARFRFSTNGGLSSVGFAGNGEVEDYAVTVVQAADLALNVTDSPDPVIAQSEVVYTVIVTNQGPAGASGVLLTNPLPSGVTFISALTTQGSCNVASGVATCALGNIASGGFVTVTLRAQANAAGTLANRFGVSTTTPEGALANNSRLVTTTVFAPAVPFSNTGAISIADATSTLPGKGSPYPSVISVSGLTGIVHKVTVTLFGMSHTFAGDLDILLVSPDGRKVLLMSDAGGNAVLSSINLTFDDAAELSLPLSGTIFSTSYRPSNYDTTSDGFPSPAPVGPYAGTLATFQGIDPNGAWSLYVMDDLSSDAGSIGGGWRLNISTSDPMADVAVGISGPVTPTALGSNLVFNVSVTNRGPAAARTRITNDFPANASVVSVVSGQGACTTSSGQIVCDLGFVSPAAVVNVLATLQPAIPGFFTNRVIASVDAMEFITSNNGASAVSLVRLATDLSVTQNTPTNLIILGQSLAYSISISNSGPNAATAVQATDRLPAGVSFVNATSSKGACGEAGGILTCDLGTLAPAEFAVLTVLITPNSTGRITNVVSVTLGEIDTLWVNNSSTNISRVALIADLGLTASVAPNPVAISNAATWTLEITNKGPSVAGGVVLTSSLPASVTFISGASDAGACTFAVGVLSCPVPDLGVGSKAAVQVVLRANQEGPLTNSFSFVASVMDPESANDVVSTVIEVEVPPFITLQPAALTVTNGRPASFSVSAAGTGSLKYQWHWNDQPLANQTNPVFSLTAAAYGNRGTYSVAITNRVGGIVSAPATLTVLVPPTVSAIPSQTLLEDTSSGPIAFVIEDIDSSPEQLQLGVESSLPTLISAGDVSFGGSSSNRTITFLPRTNQFGTVTLTLTVRDASGLSASNAFLVTVSPVNDRPELSALAPVSINEDATAGPIPVLVTDVESAGEALVLSVESSVPALIRTNDVVLGGTGANRTLLVYPVTNQFGAAVISVIVRDPEGLSATNLLDVTVLPVNDPPTLSSIPSQTIDEDAVAGPIPFVIDDVDSPVSDLILTVENSVPALVSTNEVNFGGASSNRTVTFRPQTNQFGATTLTVIVRDADGLAASNVVLVTVNAINDVPTMAAIVDQTMEEDQTLVLPIVVGDVETAAELLQLSVEASLPALLPPGALVLEGSGLNRSLTLRPVTNAFGSSIVTLVLTDGHEGRVTNTFVLTVSPVNDPPTLDPLEDLLMAENDAVRIVPLQGIGPGPDPSALLSVTAVSSDPAILPHPAVTYASPAITGTLSLIPAANTSGVVTVRVTVDDGGPTNGVFSREFSVRVLARSDWPVISILSHGPSGTDLSFATLSGLSYVVEYKEDLALATWTPLAPVTGTGGTVTVRDAGVGGSRFYRVRVE